MSKWRQKFTDAKRLDKRLKHALKYYDIDGYMGCTLVHRWFSADSSAFKIGKYKGYLFKRNKITN